MIATGSRRPLAILLLVSVLTLHLRVFEVAGYEVTLGVIGFLSVSLRGINDFPFRRAVLVLLAISAASSFGFFFGGEFDEREALRTSALIVVSTVVVVGWTGRTQIHDLLGAATWAVPRALVAVCLLSCLQTLTGSFGIEFLFNPWRSLQYLYEYDPAVAYVEFPRAQGFYLEPSFNALVILSLSFSWMLRGASAWHVSLVALPGLMATQSASGFIAAAVAVAGALIATRGRRLMSTVVLGLFAVPVVGSYVWSRLNSLTDVGSSASYRLTQPVPLIADVLQETPFGRPLGSLESAVKTYGFRMDGLDVASTLDNGSYVLIFYFGLFGLLVQVVGISILVFRLLGPRSQVLGGWLPLYWLLASLSFTGAVYSPDYTALMSLSFLCGSRISGKGGGPSVSRTAAYDRHRNLQRS